jgi:hypothetical protein
MLLRRISTQTKPTSLHVSFSPLLSRTFSFKWLRDHCQCPLCIQASSGQKLHSSGLFGNIKVQPISVSNSESDITVQWQDHKSTYQIEWLKKAGLYDDAELFTPVTWNPQEYSSNYPPIDYAQFNTQKGYLTALKTLRDSGLCFLKNVPTTEKTVEKVAEKFGTIYNTFYSSPFDVKSTPNAVNIAYTDVFLGLHMDLMYLQLNCSFL